MSRPGDGDNPVDRIVQLAHRHLGMDVAFVSRFARGRQVYRAVAGDHGSFGIGVGPGPLLEETYCARMLNGELPSIVHDARRDHRVRELVLTARQRIGAYLGVPVRLPDGRVYGSLGCLSHDPEPHLDERDLAFLSLLGEYVGAELAADAQFDESRDALADVLRLGSLQVAMQPVVSLQTGRVSALEALARFPRPVGPPDVAFATASEVGVRRELELLAMTKALAHQRTLPLPLAVNASPDVACDLVHYVPDDLPLECLVLELTEHQEVVSYATVRERLEPLRRKGLRLAIDDTGAGFASLRHVVELQPDIIKIDRTLVAGIDADRARRSVVTTFVLMALDIGASVIAEGVETEAELSTVTALGVDDAQGFLLARPSTDPGEWERWTTPGAQLIAGDRLGYPAEIGPRPARRRTDRLHRGLPR